ncbi:fasciclin domain-containing protein [Deinococcus aquaticus]|uniref:Fasciclin domain-containing protein n=1 Tax=Deinococcus aquaticus TaxID=328692 RepID=A0ABY7V013_9DEIO|nr:fasciclin domain-containing protein [Deinococcus aquaticus]WDA58497.1 fasciclin domain-containing protein [Deinococcus aquaticus]
MKKQTSFITLSLMLATPALAGGAGAPAARPAPAACMTISQIVAKDPNFSTLATALEAAGLTNTLKSGSYTVFAPTNAAFSKLPSDTLAMALNDTEMLRSILLYHVVPGKVTAKQVMGMSSGMTAQGGSFLVTVTGGKVMIDNATVTKADVVACNGIVHVIDTVLMPAMDAMQGAADTAEPAMAEPVVAEPVMAEPVAAPAAPASVDLMSIPATPVSSGMTTTTNVTTSTTTTDTAASTATTDTVATGDTMMAGTTLYDMIVADERFSTLRDLISDAELTEVLMTTDYTVFAPTNAAFENVNPEQLALIASNPDVLKQVLLYHVVTGKLTGEDLAAATQLRSAEGESLDLTLDGTSQMVNTAMIDGAAIEASNGNIYAINELLLPPELVIPEMPADDGMETTDAAVTDTTTATVTTTTTTTTTAAAPAMTGNALVDALSQPQFSTLLSLVKKADLVAALTAADVTVFAPTNDAFAKVPAATLDALMVNPDALKQVLLFHVVSGRVVDDGLKVSQLRSLEGSSIDLKMDGTNMMAGVLKADVLTGGTYSTRIDAGNSVIYPIDSVLLPPTLK